MEIHISKYIKGYFLNLSNINTETHYCNKVHVFQSKEFKRASDKITDLNQLIP